MASWGEPVPKFHDGFTLGLFCEEKFDLRQFAHAESFPKKEK